MESTWIWMAIFVDKANKTTTLIRRAGTVAAPAAPSGQTEHLSVCSPGRSGLREVAGESNIGLRMRAIRSLLNPVDLGRPPWPAGEAGLGHRATDAYARDLQARLSRAPHDRIRSGRRPPRSEYSRPVVVTEPRSAI